MYLYHHKLVIRYQTIQPKQHEYQSKPGLGTQGWGKKSVPSLTAPAGMMGATNFFTLQQKFTWKVVKSKYTFNGLFKNS